MATPVLDALDLGSNQIHHVANGTASDDAATLGQIPTPSLSGALVGSTVNTGTIEKSYLRLIVPANSLAVGSAFLVKGRYAFSGTASNVTFRVRIGTTTLTGTIPASGTQTSATITTGTFEALVVVQTTGASGTISGYLQTFDNASSPFVFTIQSVAVDTTAQKGIEFTAQAATSGGLVTIAFLTIVQLN